MITKVHIPEFAAPGDEMVFLNRNGYDGERQHAAGIFEAGKTYVVASAEIGRSSADYRFEGIKGSFNTVMFEFAEPEKIANESEEARADRRRAYNDSQTYGYWYMGKQMAHDYDVPMREYVRTSTGLYITMFSHGIPGPVEERAVVYLFEEEEEAIVEMVIPDLQKIIARRPSGETMVIYQGDQHRTWELIARPDIFVDQDTLDRHG